MGLSVRARRPAILGVFDLAYLMLCGLCEEFSHEEFIFRAPSAFKQRLNFSRRHVKKVEAIITPYILDAVREALNERGCHEIVFSEVRISRNSKSPAVGHYRGTAYELDLPKLRLEAIVPDADAMPAARAILRASRVQSSTNAKVSVCSLEQVVSIGVSAVECDEPRVFEVFDDRPRTMPQRSSCAESLHA